MKEVLISTLLIMTLASCANQTTPTGGPQDKTPPLLLSSSPTHNQKNFKGNKVELVFNEAIQLREAKEQIIITPSPAKEITFTAKKNTVIVEPETKWKDSTTYSILFRESVRDLQSSVCSHRSRSGHRSPATEPRHSLSIWRCLASRTTREGRSGGRVADHRGIA